MSDDSVKPIKPKNDLYRYYCTIEGVSADGKYVECRVNRKDAGIIRVNPSFLKDLRYCSAGDQVGFTYPEQLVFENGVAVSDKPDNVYLNKLGDRSACKFVKDTLNYLKQSVGSCCCPVSKFTNDPHSRKMLSNSWDSEDVQRSSAVDYLLRLASDPANGIVLHDNMVYDSRVYEKETYVADFVGKMMADRSQVSYSDKALKSVERRQGFLFDDSQKKAVQSCLNNRISVLTGGPGTGKTTVVQGLIAEFEASGMHVVLASPTGKAAKRMAEVTGRNAMTMHRLLEADEFGRFHRNKDAKLDDHVFIIDESSMVDLHLMYSFMSALPDDARVIFVGDEDQLPSVEAGNVFHDFLDSLPEATVRLTEIHRQGDGNKIISAARAINSGDFEALRECNSDEFTFVDIHDSDVEPSVQILKQVISSAKSCNMNDMTVLAARRSIVDKSSADHYVSSDYINKVMQHLRLGKSALADNMHCDVGSGTSMVSYYEGDPVMVMKNDYTRGVINGDQGRVVGIEPDGNSIWVQFDDHREAMQYTKEDLSNLSLAYASTIHKSQGSEYGTVIVSVGDDTQNMLTRQALYTAVTRGKQSVVVIGRTSDVKAAVDNTDRVESRRVTGLSHQIEKSKEKYASSLELSGDKIRTIKSLVMKDVSDHLRELPVFKKKQSDNVEYNIV